MSLWDDFKNSISEALNPKAVLNELLNPGAEAISRYSNRNKELQDAPVAPAGDFDTVFGERAAEAKNKAEEVAAKALALPARYAFRGITTNLIAMNPELRYLYSGGKSTGNAFQDIKNVWNESEYISPNQAIVANFGNIHDNLTNNHGSETAQNQVLNAIKKREHLDGFRNNFLADLVSGTGDFALNVFADPWVLAGKAAKVEKLRRYAQPLEKEAADVAEQSGSTWALMDYFSKQNNNAVIDEFLNNTNPKLGDVLARTKTPDEAATVWMAARGDQQAILRLREEKLIVHDEIEAINRTLGFHRIGGYSPINSLSGKEFSAGDNIALQGHQKRLAEMKDRDRFLADALDVEGTNVIVRKNIAQDATVTTANTVARQEKVISRAERSARLRWGVSEDIIPNTFQEGDAARRVTVWTRNVDRADQAARASFGQGSPMGVFHLSGANASDGAVELQAQLRSRYSPLSGVFSGEESMAYSNRYNSAINTSEQNAILEELEREGVARIATKYGVTDLREIKKVTDMLIDNKKRTVKEILDSKNASWINENGEIDIAKFLETQTPDTYVMFNWKELDSAMRNSANGLDLKTLSSAEKTKWAYDAFNSVWRPAVLFRLGYPVRNIGEGSLRFMAVSGAMMAFQGLQSGAFGNFALNRGRGATARAIRSAIKKETGEEADDYTLDLLDELEGHYAERLTMRGIDPVDFMNGGKPDPAKLNQLDQVMNEIDKVHADRIAVIEDYLTTGKYRIGVESEEYMGVVYSGAFAGASGRFLRELSSSERTKRAEIAGASRGVYGLAEDQVKAAIPTRINPEDEIFSKSLADIINTQFMNSYMFQRLIKGESPESVAKWLDDATDRNAAYVRKELGIEKGENTAPYVNRVQDVIERYLPSEELRAKAALRNLHPTDIEKAMEESGFMKVTAERIASARRHVESPVTQKNIDKAANRVRKLGNTVENIKVKLDVEPGRIAKAKVKLTKIKDRIDNFDPTVPYIVNGKKLTPYEALNDLKAKQAALGASIVKREKDLKKLPEVLRSIEEEALPRALKNHSDRVTNKKMAETIVSRPVGSAERAQDIVVDQYTTALNKSYITNNADGTFTVRVQLPSKRMKNGSWSQAQDISKTFESPIEAEKFLKKNFPQAPERIESRTGLLSQGEDVIQATDSGYPVEEAPDILKDLYYRSGMTPPDLKDGWVASTVRGADGNEYEIITKGDGYKRWQPIHGKQILTVIKEPGYKGASKRFVNRIFKYIGSLPEDTLLRHPFVKAHYDSYVQQSIKNLKEQGVDDIPYEQLQRYERNAQAYALREVKRTLYTIERYSQAAEMLRFVSPFFAAQENTLKTWGRIMLNDPAVAIRAMQAVSAPVRSGLVLDENDQPVRYGDKLVNPNWKLVVPLPSKVTKAMGIEDVGGMRISLKSLNIVFQGEFPLFPSAGPLVQMAASELIKMDDNAITRFIANGVLTMGASKAPGSVDKLAPSSIKKLWSLYRGDKSADWANDAAKIYAVLNQENNGNIPPDAIDRVVEKTNDIQLLKFFASEILPFAPQFTLKPEYQMAVDKWNMIQKQGVVDGMTPSERFLKEYPEYYSFAYSMSSNPTGTTATKTARVNTEKYQSTIRSIFVQSPGADPGFVGALLNDPNDTSYDQYTAAWQEGRKVVPGLPLEYRSSKDFKEASDQSMSAIGWDQYLAMNSKSKAILASRGLTSFRQRGAEDLQAFRRDWLAWAEETNPIWFSKYSTRNSNKFSATAKAFEIALEDPRFGKDKRNDVAWQTVGAYLARRNELRDELENRRNSGGSGTLTSESNKDLLRGYSNYINWMSDQSPRAFEIYSRYLDGEFVRFDEINV